jgi:hypothetical protein
VTRTLAVLIALAATLAACGGSEPDAEPATTPATTTTGVAATTETPSTQDPTGTTSETVSETTSETTSETLPDAAAPVEIDVVGGKAVGGVQEVTLQRGDTARFEVTVDAPQEIHIHGYELEAEATPGSPATFEFTADLEGIFDVESHLGDELIARLIVEP